MEFHIKEAREKSGYSQKELAQIIGVAQNTFHGYESGKHDPKSDLLIKIARACNTTTDFLLGHGDSVSAPEIRKAPSISDEAMKLARDYDRLDTWGKKQIRSTADLEIARCEAALQVNNHAPTVPAEEVTYYITSFFYHPSSAGTGEVADAEEPESLHLIKKPPRGTSFVVPVSGDSMEPTYHDGDKLFVRAQEEIMPGQTGIFFMDGKQWVKELGDGVLISHNPEYPPRPMAEDVRCQGLVLGVCDDSYFED